MTCEESVLQLAIKKFLKGVNKLSGKVLKKDGLDCRVWRVPEPFCAMRCINDARYMSKDTTLEAGRLSKLWESNVQFLRGWLLSFPKNLTSFRSLNVKALRNLALNEELLLYYENKHNFHGQKRTQ